MIRQTPEGAHEDTGSPGPSERIMSSTCAAWKPWPGAFSASSPSAPWRNGRSGWHRCPKSWPKHSPRR